ncbi:MAG TPA: hypothetical protein VMU73_05700, partial [Gaiellaceae bacterium]|nr:hypothetical protein [Gaiellaceae bacterium]
MLGRAFSRDGSWTRLGAGGVLAAAYTGARLWLFWPARAGVGPTRYGDAVEYLRVSRLSLLSLQFYTEHKPFGYPLVLKIAGRDQALVVWLQLAVSIACWAFLAIVIARRVRGARVRWFAAATVLLFSASWPIAQWDTLVLTESLSLSIFALLAGLAFVYVDRPRRGLVVVLVSVALFFTALRDANGLLAAIVLALVAITLAARRRRGVAMLLLGAAATCVLLVAATSSVRRWEILFADQIGKRVVANPTELSYFRAHGMPLPAHLSSIIFSDTRGPHPAASFEHDPRLARFMPWFMSEARPTYESYLLSHPADSVGAPLRKLPVMLSDSGLSTYRAPGFRELPNVVEELIYPSDGGRLLSLELALLGVAALGVLRGLWQRDWVLPLGLVLGSVPLAVFVWDGEPSEV